MSPHSPIQRASPGDLPYELLLQLFSYINDDSAIINLLLTQKSLCGRLLSDERFYRDLCARHVTGLVDHIKLHFHPDRSFKSIFTQLFYKHGCLLGLWAGDIPFRGTILEFRLVSYAEDGWEGIVGQVWSRFRGRHRVPAIVRKPIIRIKLPPISSYHTTQSSNPACVYWRGHSADEWLPESPDLPSEAPKPRTILGSVASTLFPSRVLDQVYRPPPAIMWLAPTTQSTYIVSGPLADIDNVPTCDLRARAVLHPEFPFVQDGTYPVWYDQHRVLPLSRQKALPTIDNFEMPHRPRLSYLAHYDRLLLLGAPSDVDLLKPASLTISGPPSTSFSTSNLIRSLQEVRLPSVVDLRAESQGQHESPHVKFPRYYPLRNPRLPKDLLSLSPRNQAWHPEQLEGLWRTVRPSHENDIVYLTFSPSLRQVEAWKITGAGYLPRGMMNWWFRVDNLAELDDRSVEILSQIGPVPEDAMSYTGLCIQFDEGLEKMRDVLTVVVVSNSDIWIRWPSELRPVSCLRCLD